MPFLERLGKSAGKIFYQDVAPSKTVVSETIPLILLHHGTGSVQSWRRQIPWLTEKCRVIAYDRLGHGQSDPLKTWSPWYHQEGVEELIELMDSLKLEYAALVGHSDGATISLLAAAKYPSRFSSIVAEAPHMFHETDVVLKGFADFRQTMLNESRFQNALAREHGDNAQVVLNRWLNWWEDPINYKWDDRSFLPEVSCPVLCIHGRQDLFFSVDHTEKIASAVQNGRVEFLNAGHDIHSGAQDEYKEKVLAFFESHQDLEISCNL